MECKTDGVSACMEETDVGLALSSTYALRGNELAENGGCMVQGSCQMEKLEIDGKVDWKGRTAVKYRHGGARASLLILAALAFESVATLSLAVNGVTYFTVVMHFDLPAAANQLTTFMGVCNILSILGGVLGDTYIGRFKVVVISGFLEVLGLGLLTTQAHYPHLKPANCNMYDPNDHCEKVNGCNAALLFLGLYILACGSGGLRACAPAHGADQFEKEDPKEAKQMSSFFNAILLGVCLGGVVSLTLFVWIQNERGWDWGFGLSTLAIFFGMVTFALGLPLYRIHVVHGTSPIIEIIQVYVAAIRNRNLALPQDTEELFEIDHYDKEAAVGSEFLPQREIFRFLDKAAIKPKSIDDGEKSEPINPWKLCRVTQVENAKTLLGMVPIFCCTIIMTLCLAQLQTFSVLQGLTMDTSLTKSFHIPPASLPLIPILFIVVVVPIYDQILVPILRKLTGIPTGITHLQRVGVGLVLSFISMGVAGIIEVKRKNVARDHNMLDAVPGHPPLPISTFWLSFQYFIFGIADIFTYVGLLQFFYSEAPKSLRSMSTCFLWSSMAFGYFFSSIVVKIVDEATKKLSHSEGWLEGNNINRNHLNLFYWLLAVLSVINFCIYLIVSRRYQYKHEIPMTKKLVVLEHDT